MVAAFLAAMQAIYSAEVELSLVSHWDAGWVVELSDAAGSRVSRRFDDGQSHELGAWVCAQADSLAPGWRKAALA